MIEEDQEKYFLLEIRELKKSLAQVNTRVNQFNLEIENVRASIEALNKRLAKPLKQQMEGGK